MRLRDRLVMKLRGWSADPPPRAVLPADAEALLGSMYAWEPQVGNGGEHHPMDGATRLSRARGDLLHHYYREVKPDLSIEIGLAYGFSTVFLLSALHEQGRGHHIAIDPLQSSSWKGIGAARAALLGLEECFTAIEEPSHLALARLALERPEAQLVFIDGDHRFDAVLLDFTLADLLLSVEGVIVFDDLWLPSIRRAVSFVARNRGDYRLLPTRHANMAAFRKVRSEDARPWDHFVPF